MGLRIEITKLIINFVKPGLGVCNHEFTNEIRNRERGEPGPHSAPDVMNYEWFYLCPLMASEFVKLFQHDAIEPRLSFRKA